MKALQTSVYNLSGVKLVGYKITAEVEEGRDTPLIPELRDLCEFKRFCRPKWSTE